LEEKFGADDDESNLRMQEKKHKSRMKGTIFTKCQLPSELFNAERIVKTKIKQYLSRIGYLMLRDGTIEVKGTKKPDLGTKETIELLGDLESRFQLGSFAKPDYFASFSLVDGIISSEQFKRKGMQIHCLDNRMIYPLYGVYMPTS